MACIYELFIIINKLAVLRKFVFSSFYMNYMLEEGQSIDDPNTGNNKINKKNDINSLNKNLQISTKYIKHKSLVCDIIVI